MSCHGSAVRAVSVFEKINTLPGSEYKLTTHNWDVDGYGREGGFDMRGHIIRAFASMVHPAHRRVIRIGHETLEKLIHVPADIGVRIFRYQKRTGGMAHKKRKEARFSFCSADILLNQLCEFV